jgi:SET domain-containing protein
MDTIGDHVREGYIATGWCPRCLHVEPIDLVKALEEGRGEQRFNVLESEFRCPCCESRGQVTSRRVSVLPAGRHKTKGQVSTA